MVVDEFEYDLFRAGYIHIPPQSADTENETIIHDKETDWQVLFPEAIQNTNNNLVTNNFSDQVEESDQEAVNNNNSKQFSTLSDDSSEDLIVIDHRLVSEQPSTSNNDQQHYFSGKDDVKFARTVSEDGWSPSSSANLSEHDEELENIDCIEHTLSHDLEESPIRKPPIHQVMRKDDGAKYDPRRIPSSVFDRCDSLIPAEWSATSNESLFSLNIGNNSIERDDRALSLSDELKKPAGLLLPKSRGELGVGHLHEIRKLAGLPNNNNNNNNKANYAIHEDADEGEEGVGVSTSNEDKNGAGKEEEVLKMISAIKFGKQKHKQEKIHSSSISLHSNTSEDSNYSFAFPVFGEAEKNALAKGFLHKQNSQKQQDLKAIAPRPSSGSGGGSKSLFSSFLKIFSCNSCRRHCASCSSCADLPSWRSCSSCVSLPSCPSCSSCVYSPSCRKCSSCVYLRSCPSCSTCLARFSCASCKSCCL